MINPDLIQQFTEKLEERNASDLLEDMIANYDGYLANFLMAKQMRKNNYCDDPDCLHCNPDTEPFEDDLIN